MSSVTARGAASITAIDGGGGKSGGMLDLSTPAGWHSVFWWGSVVVILFFLWAL